MRSDKLIKQIALIFFFFLSLAACAPEQETAVTPTPLPTATIPPTATAVSPTSTAPAAARLTPVPTPTATAVPPPLSPENAAAITQIAQFGKGRINGISWSPDATILAVASSTGIHLYDAATLEQFSTVDSQLPVLDLFFTPQAGTLLVINEGDLSSVANLVNMATGEIVFTLNGIITGFSADGATAVAWSGSDDANNTVTLSWHNLQTGAVERTVDLPQPPLAYNPAAEMFLDVADPTTNRQLRLIDGISGETLRLIDLPTYWGSAAFNPQGDLLAVSGGDHAVRLYDVASGELLRVLEGHTGWIDGVVFSGNGRFLATSSLDDNSARLWSAASGELLHALPGSGQLGFSPDGRELTVKNEDQVLFFDTVTGQLLRTLAGYSRRVASAAFSPDGRYLAATGGNGKSIRLWDTSSGELLRTIEGDEYLTAVAFSPDGRILAWGGGGPLYQVQLYDLKAERRLDTLSGHDESLFSINFSPDGQIMVTTSWNGNGIFWDMVTLEQVFSQPVNFHVAFHPNGQLFALEQNDGEGHSIAQIWDLATWQLLRIFPIAGHLYTFNPEGQLLAEQTCCEVIRSGLLDIDTGQFIQSIYGVGGNAVLSPDGHLVAGSSGYGGDGNALLLWDAGSGKRLHELHGHADFYSVVFSGDGRYLATASADGTVRLWGLPPEAP